MPDKATPPQAELDLPNGRARIPANWPLTMVSYLGVSACVHALCLILLTPAHPPLIPQRSHAQTRTHFLIVNEDGHVLQVRAALPSGRHLGQVSSQTFKGRAVHLHLGEAALSLSGSGLFMTIATLCT